MKDIVTLLMETSISIVIIGLFIWDWIKNKGKINETLEQNSKILDEIKISNKNTAKSLELLQKTMDNQNDFLYKHDKRCENIEKSIEVINIKMERS